MSKFVRGYNSNKIRVGLLFIVRIIALAAPPVSAVIIFLNTSFDLKIWLIWAVLSALLIVLYFRADKNYKILNSGLKGEKKIYNILKDIPEAVIFTNMPIQYKGLKSELDFLAVSQKGIVIIEVKNHSGIISGAWNSGKWTHTHYKKRGKPLKDDMNNPIKQMERQKDILKNLLSEYGETVKISAVLCFSSDNAELRLKLRDTDNVRRCCDLRKFLERPKGTGRLSNERVKRITGIIKKIKRRG